MNINEAFEQLKNGHHIARKSWENVFTDAHVFISDNVNIVLKSLVPGSSTYWVISKSDIYANDWYVKELK